MGHPVYIHLDSNPRPADGSEPHCVAPVQAEVHQVLAPSLEAVAFAAIWTLFHVKNIIKKCPHILFLPWFIGREVEEGECYEHEEHAHADDDFRLQRRLNEIGLQWDCNVFLHAELHQRNFLNEDNKICWFFYPAIYISANHLCSQTACCHPTPS